MKIMDLKTTVVHVPFSHRPYRWHFGIKPGATSILIEIFTDEGPVGIGEAPCLFYPYMPVEPIREVVEAARPYILGEEPFNIERTMAKLYGTGAWHFARHAANWAFGGLEMALWDIVGKACRQPLYKLLGGFIRREVPFIYFIYRDSPEKMASEAVEAKLKGFKTFYIKVGEDIDQEIEQIEAIRAAVGYGVNLRVDANEAWSSGAALRYIKRLERYELEFVEQPVMATDLEGMARLRRSVGVPICSDQSTRTIHEVLRAVELKAADIISFDPSDAGGILASKKVSAITEAAGIPTFIHSNVELGVATAAHLHLAVSTPNCTYANQTEYQFLADDIIEGQGFQFFGGCLKPPEGPGLGVSLDRDKVQRYSEHYQKTRDEAARLVNAERVPLLPGY